MYLNKNWYCLEFDLTGSDLGFTTRFWISMTELFVTMNSFMIAERNRNQWIYQWICDIQIIWKLSYLILLRIIVFELFEHWTMLIVFLFLVLIISEFYSRISEKHDRTSNFVVGSYEINPVHLSICMSVMHFPQDLLCGFFIFPKFYSQIRLQDCLNFNISKIIWGKTGFFLYVVRYPWKL